jgi:hypothetical protein
MKMYKRQTSTHPTVQYSLTSVGQEQFLSEFVYCREQTVGRQFFFLYHAIYK